MIRKLAGVLLLAALASCTEGGATGTVSNGVVRVEREDVGLRLTNLTDTPRAYSAWDPEWLAVADLSLQAICVTPDSACLRLPAMGSVLVPYTEIGGYNSGTSSVVVWTWRVVPSTTPGQYQAAMDESVTFRL